MGMGYHSCKYVYIVWCGEGAIKCATYLSLTQQVDTHAIPISCQCMFDMYSIDFAALDQIEHIWKETINQTVPCHLLHSWSPHRTAVPTADDGWRVQWQQFISWCVATGCGQGSVEWGSVLHFMVHPVTYAMFRLPVCNMHCASSLRVCCDITVLIMNETSQHLFNRGKEGLYAGAAADMAIHFNCAFQL